ncbi:MAG: DNA-processing protein DprA, partial [Rikenellaceae bacterium]
MINSLAFTYFNFPKSTVIDALVKFGSAKAILNSSFYELTYGEAFSEKAAEKILRYKEEFCIRAAQEIKRMEDFGIKIIPYGSEQYPTLLAECEDAPSVLFVMGNCDLIVGNEKWITIVGTRSCSEIGMLITEKLLEDVSLKAKDTVVVSTLSAGIETKVHCEAIKRGLRAVGVISTSHDAIANLDLASEILKYGGAIISEYPLGKGYTPNAYAERNRIAAGLSHATVIVEADAGSNTLTTADLAKSYNREVF